MKELRWEIEMKSDDCLTKTQNYAKLKKEVCGLRPAQQLIIKHDVSSIW